MSKQPKVRTKSTQRALSSILMAFESLVVFFATLVAFGTKVLGPSSQDAATVWAVGLTLSVLFILTPAILGKPGSYAFGWVLQIAVVFIGVWVPLMYVVGGIFLCLWIWAMVAGSTIDKARAAY
jgi:asparagine N-glycosylation enzyme membrane subunit Stt3